MEALSILDWGAATEQGSRPHQEDRYTYVQPQDFPNTHDKRLAFFAVYDGHGGPDVSDHASKNLHLSLVSSPAFQAGAYEKAVRDAIQVEEKQLFDGFANGKNDSSGSGSTLSLALIDLTKGELVIASLGDSHIGLVERERGNGLISKPKRLTKADSPGESEEMARIEDAGGRVRVISGQARIGTINMSRALGDFQYKQPLNSAEAKADLISSKPHVFSLNLDPNCISILLIATDGVWNAIGDEPLFQFITGQMQEGHSAETIAGKIAQQCASKEHSDNVTCILLLLGAKEHANVENGHGAV